MKFEPGLDELHGVWVRSDARIDFLLGQMSTIPEGRKVRMWSNVSGGRPLAFGE
jgi:hypothetical protein